jgi:cytohesin
MSDETFTSPSGNDFQQQRKRAKDLLKAFNDHDPAAIARVHAHRPGKIAIKLADAQRVIALEQGFRNWAALKRHLLPAELAALPPLHAAAASGDVRTLTSLLRRGVDPNARDGVDRATPLHFAASYGHFDVAERLLDAGADVNAAGDDHDATALGWATTFRHYHEAVARLLLSRGARHTIFTAIAVDDAPWVRTAIAHDRSLLTRPMSRNEHHRLPLHLAVVKNRLTMVDLLIELGADVHARDTSGTTPLGYATAATDQQIVHALRAAGAELTLIAALRMRRFDLADELATSDPSRLGADGSDVIALHLSTFDRNIDAVRWLLARGVDPNAKRELWACNLTALHVCAEHGIPTAARELLDAGADPAIEDDKYAADVLSWAKFCRQPEIAALVMEARR